MYCVSAARRGARGRCGAVGRDALSRKQNCSIIRTSIELPLKLTGDIMLTVCVYAIFTRENMATIFKRSGEAKFYSAS